MRIRDVGVSAMVLSAATAMAPSIRAHSAEGEDHPNALFEAEVSAREAETGRRVDPAQRAAVLARMARLEEPNAVGDTAADLVFTPLPPCRIIDTRVPTAGVLSVGVARPFLVAGSSAAFAGQGGTGGGCGVPVGATSAMLNLVATGSVGPGNLHAVAWGPGTPVMPNASIINFGAVSGLVSIANGLALPICDPATTTCTYDLYVQAYVNNTHLVVDVVGYFSSVQGVVTGAQAPLQVSGSSVRLSTTGCATGYVWKWNGSAWTCSPDVDTNTTYSAASPVALSGTTFGLSTTGCAAGYVWKWSGSAWACSPDVDTNTTYSAGTGLDLAGGVFSVDPTDFNKVPAASFSDAYVDFADSWVVAVSQSIVSPVPGRVLAIASGEMITAGGSAAVQTVLSTTAYSSSGTATYTYMSDSYGYTHPVAMAVLDVSAGTTWVYWNMVRTSGSTPYVRCLRPKIALIFIPS